MSVKRTMNRGKFIGGGLFCRYFDVSKGQIWQKTVALLGLDLVCLVYMSSCKLLLSRELSQMQGCFPFQFQLFQLFFFSTLILFLYILFIYN